MLKNNFLKDVTLLSRYSISMALLRIQVKSEIRENWKINTSQKYLAWSKPMGKKESPLNFWQLGENKRVSMSYFLSSSLSWQKFNGGG